MKKLYYLTNVFNLIFGLFLFINTYMLYDFNINIVLTFIGLIMFEASIFISYFKEKENLSFVDYFMLSFYFIFVISFMLFMLIYQKYNNTNLNMIYYSKVLFIPHFLYAIFTSR